MADPSLKKKSIYEDFESIYQDTLTKESGTVPEQSSPVNNKYADLESIYQKTLASEPQEERGIGSAFVRGAAQAAKGVAGAMRMTDLDPEQETNIIARTGKRISDYIGEAEQKYDILKPDTTERGFVGRGVVGAAESITPSLLPLGGALAGGKIGAGIGSFFGPAGAAIGGAAGAVIGGGATLFGTFGAGQYQNTYDETVKILREQGGLSEKEIKEKAKSHALVSATAETGGELVGDVAAATFFGLLGKKAAKQTVKQTIKKLLSAGGAKEFGKAYLKTAPFEIGSEMGTAYFQTKSAQETGLPGPTTGEAMKESMLPAAILSLAFGSVIRGSQAVDAHGLYKSLNSENVEERTKAAAEVAKRLDPEERKTWTDIAQNYIDTGQEMPLSKPIIDFASQDAPTEDTGGQAEKVKQFTSNISAGLQSGEISKEQVTTLINDPQYAGMKDQLSQVLKDFETPNLRNEMEIFEADPFNAKNNAAILEGIKKGIEISEQPTIESIEQWRGREVEVPTFEEGEKRQEEISKEDLSPLKDIGDITQETQPPSKPADKETKQPWELSRKEFYETQKTPIPMQTEKAVFEREKEFADWGERIGAEYPTFGKTDKEVSQWIANIRTNAIKEYQKAKDDVKKYGEDAKKSFMGVQTQETYGEALLDAKRRLEKSTKSGEEITAAHKKDKAAFYIKGSGWMNPDILKAHEKSVTEAFKEGKKIPESVLKDYPDLIAPTETKKEPVGKAKPKSLGVETNPEMLQKINLMQDEVNASRTRGVTQEHIGRDSETIGFPADSPQWMRDLPTYLDNSGKKRVYSRVQLNAVFDNVRNGKKLTKNQEELYSHLEKAMDEYAGQTGEFVSDEAADLEAKGYDPLGGANVTVAELNKGDKFIGTVDGVKDEWEVKGENKQGEVILMDGVKKEVDSFDEVIIEGIKKAPEKKISEVQESLDLGEDFMQDKTGQKEMFSATGKILKKEPKFATTEDRTTIKKISDSWKLKGIDNFISEKNGIITLSEIRVPKGERKTGVGTKAMKELVGYADRTGQKIVLTPSKDYGASSVSRLKKFYKRFGFVENKGRNKDYRIRETMFRRPETKLATTEDRKQTETKAFKKWFGKSKVVDKDGNPLLVHHGTNKKFSIFMNEFLGKATKSRSALAGFFFVDNYETAQGYADFAGERAVQDLIDKSQDLEREKKWDESVAAMEAAEKLEQSGKHLEGSRVMSGYLQIENPVIIDAEGGRFLDFQDEIHDAIKKAQDNNNDGVIIKNLDDNADWGSGRIADHYIIFDSTQMKSDKNIGTYGVTEPNIYLQTDATPGEGVTLSDIQAQFPNQEVFLSPDGSISIRMKNGMGLRITNVKQMPDGMIQYAIDTGRMGKKGTILGGYQSGNILLNQDIADPQTLSHEVYHWLKEAKLILPGDRLALRAEMNKLIRNGKFGYNKSTLKDRKVANEEDEANTFATILKLRKEYRGTRLGRLVEKVLDFLDSIRYIGRSSIRKIAKSVETGKIYGKEGKIQTKTPAFEQAAEKWYSALEKAVDTVSQKAMPAKQWIQLLKSNKFKQLGVKSDEVYWTGIVPWLEGQKKVTKQEVVDYLNENRVVVKEIVKGKAKTRLSEEETKELAVLLRNVDLLGFSDMGEAVSAIVNNEDWVERWDLGKETRLVELGKKFRKSEKEFTDSSNATKFSQYQLAGGENYKEMLLTLPIQKLAWKESFSAQKGTTVWDSKAGDRNFRIQKEADGTFYVFEKDGVLGQTQRSLIGAKHLAQQEIRGESFKGPHYDEPNILAHVRLSERTVDGKRVLHIEELQSDFNAEHRKQVKNIDKSVTMNFKDIVKSMEKAGVLEEVC